MTERLGFSLEDPLNALSWRQPISKADTKDESGNLNIKAVVIKVENNDLAYNDHELQLFNIRLSLIVFRYDRIMISVCGNKGR